MRWTLLLLCITFCHSVFGQKTFSQLTNEEKTFYTEHVVEGQPDGDTEVLVRRGYVCRYNSLYRIPDWVAYHIVVGYLDTPERKGRFDTFRTDPDVDKPVKDPDYTGSKYARGHMAPYFAMGGHRDGSSEVGEFDTESTEDQQTIFEANYMTNISPQHQLGLNGPGGAWYALETAIRTKLVKGRNMELHLVVGTIISDRNNLKTLKSSRTGKTGIVVPDSFFQVLIYLDPATNEFVTAAFVFPHVKKKPNKPLLDYLVTVDFVESVTGLDFLNKLSKERQDKFESKTNLAFWQEKLK